MTRTTIQIQFVNEMVILITTTADQVATTAIVAQAQVTGEVAVIKIFDKQHACGCQQKPMDKTMMVIIILNQLKYVSALIFTVQTT